MPIKYYVTDVVIARILMTTPHQLIVLSMTTEPCVGTPLITLQNGHKLHSTAIKINVQ